LGKTFFGADEMKNGFDDREGPMGQFPWAVARDDDMLELMRS